MNKQGRKLLFVLLLLFVSVATTFSQVTTSGISGRVVTSSGESLPGAAVVAVHVPSGTQYGTITGPDGRYVIKGILWQRTDEENAVK